MSPKVYSRKEHSISTDQIDRDALFVIETLQAAGFTSYLVGGSIRDLLLGHTPKDYDISTEAHPEEIKALFKSRCILIGRRFRLAHIRFKGKIIEVATFRSGNEGEDLITHDNTWGSPEEDVLRRDFKINGLFYDPKEQTIIDYVGGFEDIQNRTLRVIGEPYVRFKQDPVRMIRLIKFLARFDLKIDEQSRLDFFECRSEILKSSQARILEEIMKMLHSGAAARFMRLMAEWGLLTPLFPELASFLQQDQKHVIFSYLEHVDTILEKFPEASIDRSILVACLIFPLIDEQIHNLSDDRKKPPHLGQIQNLIKVQIDTYFSPFFQLSRKIKSEVHHIITWQYRLVPLKKDAKINYRAQNSILFVHSVKFLNLRARIHPELLPVWEAWRQVYEQAKKEYSFSKPARKSYRRRRRR